MNINPTHHAHATSNVQRLATKAYAAETGKPADTARPGDRVELSGADELQRLVQMAKSGDVRMDKVAALKAEIAAGTYDLDAKADQVADRLLDDLGL